MWRREHENIMLSVGHNSLAGKRLSLFHQLRSRRFPIRVIILPLSLCLSPIYSLFLSLSRFSVRVLKNTALVCGLFVTHAAADARARIRACSARRSYTRICFRLPYSPRPVLNFPLSDRHRSFRVKTVPAYYTEISFFQPARGRERADLVAGWQIPRRAEWIKAKEIAKGIQMEIANTMHANASKSSEIEVVTIVKMFFYFFFRHVSADRQKDTIYILVFY